jgi:hypothetical protein
MRNLERLLSDGLVAALAQRSSMTVAKGTILGDEANADRQEQPEKKRPDVRPAKRKNRVRLWPPAASFGRQFHR